MGEPALQLPEEDQPAIKPDLRALEGGGETTPRKGNHLRRLDGDAKSLAAAERGLGESQQSSAPNGHGSSLLDDINDRLGRGYQDNGQEKSWASRALRGKSKMKKRMAIAAVAGGGGIVAAVIAFIALLPLKIESIVTNLEKQSGAASAQAMDKESSRLFRGYVTKYIIPSLKAGRCRSTIDANCVVKVAGDGPVAQLYKGWSNNRFERKLAERGLSFGRTGSNTYYINTGGKQIDFNGDKNVGGDKRLSDFLNDPNTTRGSKHEVEQAISKHLKESTLWERVYYRFRLAPFLNKKYGIRHCINSCKAINKFTDKVSVKKKAAKAYVIQRVVTPLSESYGLILQCVLEGQGGCNTKLEPAAEGDDTRTSEVNTKLQEQLAAYAATVTGKPLEELVRVADDVGTDGFSKVIARSLAKKIGSLFGKEVTGEAAAKAVPVVGWAFLVAQVTNSLQTIGPTIRYLSYAANAAAAAQLFAAYQTVASETKSGQIDATQLGSFNTALSTNLSGSSNDSSDVTQTPLYQATTGSASTQTSFLPSMTPTTYADSSQNKDGYLCSDGEPVPSGKLVCDEEKLDRGNGFADDLSSSVKSVTGKVPGFNVLVKIVNGLGNLVGGALGSAFDKSCNTAGKLVGCPAIVGKVSDIAGEFMGFVINKLVSSPITDNMSGGRSYDMMAAGASVSFNSSCQENLGCPQIDDKTAAAIQSEYLKQQLSDFNQRPFFARMFSTDSPYSFVSRLAVSMPGNVSTTASDKFAALQINPLGTFGRLFSNVFSTHSAFASSAVQTNPFGVPQAAYSDSQIPNDPEKFWDKNCINGPEGLWHEDNAVGEQLDISPWLNNDHHYKVSDGTYVDFAPNGDNVTRNENTGQATFLKPNRCLLILASVQSTGGTSDPSLLPTDALTSDESTGSGAALRIASFNMRGASHTNGSSNPVDDYRNRMGKSIAAMNNNNLEIVGMQELQDPQYDLFKKQAGSKYDITKKGGNHLTENAIAWDKSKYTLVDSGIMPNLKYFFGSKLADPWVKLRATASGQEFFVLNTHDPADANGCECSSERYHDALEHSSYISKLKAQGLPILFTGDFNSGYTKNPMGHNGSAYQDKNENLTYCILTRDGLVNDSYDLYKKRPVKCPNPLEKGDSKGAANGIDHIYLSPGITVSNFFRIPVGYDSNGSDHPTAVADVTLPGGGVVDGDASTASPGTGFVGNDGFGGGSCVAYVEYILNHHSSKYHGGALGNGKDVANSLGRYGYTVNHSPAIHAVVSFPTSMADPTYGHVAIVGKINADGSIVVEESNWTNPNRYGTHTVSASQVKKLTYAHTEVGWH